MRKDPSQLQVMMWGKDEVVCDEKQLNAMSWYGTEGKLVVRPKDKGGAMHISGNKSREAGWMPTPTAAQLREINRRRAGSKYVAEDAAIEVLGSAL